MMRARRRDAPASRPGAEASGRWADLVRGLEAMDDFFDYPMLARAARRLRSVVGDASLEARLDKVIAAAAASVRADASLFGRCCHQRRRPAIVPRMARPRSITGAVQPLVADFAAKLATLVDGLATERARDAVMRALGTGDRRRRAAPVKRERRMPAARSGPPNRARVLQGRYMGGLRGLSKGSQARVKKVRQKQGIGAALGLIDKLK